MSDNEKPVDLGPIELRLRAAMQEKESYSPGIGSDILNDWPTIIDEDYDFVTAPLAQELFDHAPTDIAALLQRVRELEAEKTKVFDWIEREIEDWKQYPDTNAECRALRMLRTRLTRDIDK